MGKIRIALLCWLLCLTGCAGSVSPVPSTAATADPIPRTLRILCVGNSFAEDTLRRFGEIAQQAGVKKIVLGNLYLPGCSIQRHYKNAQTQAAVYTYKKYEKGAWVSTKKAKFDTGLRDERWDYISLQMYSGHSGLAQKYNKSLDGIIKHIQSRKRKGKLIWLMTWAYPQKSNQAAFAFYNHDQSEMYSAITAAVQKKILLRAEFEHIIPIGTTIQNARLRLGDRFNRDSLHLTKDDGSWLAGATLFATLTGIVPQNDNPTLRACVEDAVQNPYSSK